ncbi:MAG: hypothetical protein F4152_00150 [Dehalococcoidia bacterium]|nr:hypothetical protein [Dehalococcoidia bacterium]
MPPLKRRATAGSSPSATAASAEPAGTRSGARSRIRERPLTIHGLRACMLSPMGVFPAGSSPLAVADGVSFAPRSSSPVAVLDLGSNSARVVVFDHPIPGVVETIAEERLDLRLATELDHDSLLSERGVATTIDAVAEFAGFAREAGASSIKVVATAAIRSARNRAELLARAHAELGLAIEVLDGAEEAELAAVGALHGLPIRSGVIVDVGGGSTEVARVIAGTIVGAWSFPLGALGASAEWLTDDPPTRKQVKAMRRMIADTLATNAPSRLDGGEELIATGGSARPLARLAQRQTDYPLPLPHGYSLDRGALRDVNAFLMAHTAAERSDIDGVRSGRADSIVGGAVILDELMGHLGADRLTIAAGGLREGVAMRAFGEPVPQPRLVRAASVEALLRHHNAWDEGEMEARASLVDSLPSDLIDDPFSDTLEAARLAAMLRAIGERAGAARAGASTVETLLAQDMAGFDHAMLARVIATLHSSDGEKSAAAPFLDLLPASEKRLLRRCGALLAGAGWKG